MIRQNSLIQSAEPQTPQIEANVNNIKEESLDCGITAIKCCNTPTCQKLGTSKSFLIILSFVGIFQGAAERYFLISLRQAAVKFGYHPTLVDWLLVTSGILQGILAVIITYWGNRVHRISWLSFILILQSISCLVVIIPTLTHSTTTESLDAIIVNNLCTNMVTSEIIDEPPYSMTTLACLFILQLGIALGNIVYHTLALSYMDDNIQEHESPAFIAVALAAKIWGVQWGAALSLGISHTPLGWWLGWTIIGPILFILAILIALFPKKLLSTVVRQAADNIIERATNNSQLSLSAQQHKFLADISFGNSMKRMFTNKILMFNVVAAVFVESGIVNFFAHEHNYLQSRFYLPVDETTGVDNIWTSRLLTNLLKPPLVALAIIVAGLIIAKANPNPRKLAAWNIITASIVCILFIIYIFIDCNHSPIAGATKGKLTMPFCSRNCLCDPNIPFSPVCPHESVQTYFSPCHAGCSSVINVNNQRIFSNCTCGVDVSWQLIDGVASEGACGYKNCQRYWIIFQALTVFGASLLGSGLIGNLLLSIRSVLPQDKALALSMELWFLGLIVYIPAKIGYRAIADSTCQYFSPDLSICHLHENPLFGNILNIVTASLIAVGIFFDILVFIYVKDLELYGDEPDDAYRPIQMQSMPVNRNNNNNINRYDDINIDDGPNNETEGNPLLAARNVNNMPMIQSIQNTQSSYRSISPNSDATTYRMDAGISPNSNEQQPFSITPQSSLPSTTSSPLVNHNVYAQIKKELDFRLAQSPSSLNSDNSDVERDDQSKSVKLKISENANKNQSLATGTTTGDSTSNVALNLSHMESPASSRSGDVTNISSNVSPVPETKLKSPARPLSPETDF